MDDTLLNTLKTISLRGRMAYSVACLEEFLLAHDCDLNHWKPMLRYLWRCGQASPEDWQQYLAEMMPSNVAEAAVFSYEELAQAGLLYALEKDDYLYIRTYYQQNPIPKRLIPMFRMMIYTSSFPFTYPPTTKKEQEAFDNSFSYLEDLVQYFREENLPLPKVEPFVQYAAKDGDKRFDAQIHSKLHKLE